MKTAPRLGGCGASVCNRSGTSSQRKGWRQQNTRNAIAVSPSQASANSPQPGRSDGSDRLTKRIATNSIARTSE